MEYLPPIRIKPTNEPIDIENNNEINLKTKIDKLTDVVYELQKIIILLLIFHFFLIFFLIKWVF